MTLKPISFSIIIITLLLSIIVVQGALALSISYSSTTNTNGAYSSSIGGSSTSLGNSLSIQSSSVTSGTTGSSESNVAGNESESFTVDDPPASDPDFGDILVTSSPVGASITLNTFLQPNLTPTLITMLNPGKYSLIIKIEGYEPFSQDIEIMKGKQKTVVADFDGNYTSQEDQKDAPTPKETQSAGVWS